MKIERRHKKQCDEGVKKVSLTTETLYRNFVLREAETTLSLPCKRCVVPLRSNMIKNDRKIRLLPNAQKCPCETKVLLRQNISNMKKNIDIQKRCGKDENFVSFIPNRDCSNFVLQEEKILCPQVVKGV